MDELLFGNCYLIKERYASSAPIVLVKVTDKTELCYRLLYENGYSVWKTKKEFDNEFVVIEDLGEREIDQ